MEFSRSLMLPKVVWCFPSEVLDFSLFVLEDLRLGFSNISGSTILPHYFLISFERLEIVTRKE